MTPLSLAALLEDPPQVHPYAEGGVWRTAIDCYEFMAEHARGRRTLETGLGVSTLVLSMVAEHHTSLFRFAEEGERLRAHCADRGIDIGNLDLIDGPSHETLPALRPEVPFDLVFIDGGHGFPMPILDWFFCARWLRPGGVVVVDDLQLPAPALLAGVLDADERWPRAAGTTRWAAFRRAVDYDLSDDHDLQPLGPLTLAAHTTRTLGVASARQHAVRARERLRRGSVG